MLVLHSTFGLGLHSTRSMNLAKDFDCSLAENYRNVNEKNQINWLLSQLIVLAEQDFDLKYCQDYDDSCPVKLDRKKCVNVQVDCAFIDIGNFTSSATTFCHMMIIRQGLIQYYRNYKFIIARWMLEEQMYIF